MSSASPRCIARLHALGTLPSFLDSASPVGAISARRACATECPFALGELLRACMLDGIEPLHSRRSTLVVPPPPCRTRDRDTASTSSLQRSRDEPAFLIERSVACCVFAALGCEEAVLLIRTGLRRERTRGGVAYNDRAEIFHACSFVVKNGRACANARHPRLKRRESLERGHNKGREARRETSVSSVSYPIAREARYSSLVLWGGAAISRVTTGARCGVRIIGRDRPLLPAF